MRACSAVVLQMILTSASGLGASELDLAGTWRLSTPSATNVWDCAIPGDNASALLSAGFLRDPFWKGQEDCVQWLGNADWTFVRTFDAEALLTRDGERRYLEFDSIDTVADVVLNGVTLGSVANEFRAWRFDVTQTLRPKGNVLEVRVKAPRKEAEARWLETPDYDIRSWAVTQCREINCLRKCQCSFGWDWGCSLPVSGLYGGVRLVSCSERLERPWAEARLLPDGSADVIVHTGVSPRSTLGGVCVFNGETKSFVGDRALFRVAKPELWWPNGMGAQKLYDWSVTFDGQVAKGRLGIRKLELVREKDAEGESFGFRVNGRDFFTAGVDWIPCDAFPVRRTPERIRALLASAAAANVNCVRVWGGGTYESAAFYEACDELGLLVWQDFMFACGRYPATETFLSEIAAEAEHQVKRLRPYTSILLWCGDNECIGGVREKGRYQDDWIKWNGVLAAAVAKHAPGTIWWPSSPCAGPGDFTYNELTGDRGDTHYWGVWHGARDLSGYRLINPRFVSEFGYQSLPSVAMVARSGGVIHQKNRGGNEKIDRMLAKLFPEPKDFASRLYLSQVQQALAIESAVAYWKTLWPRCRGAVVWQLNDWWPVASWSSLEYDGRWKPLHYAMRRFFAADYDAKRRDAELRNLDFRTKDLPAANVRIASVTLRADGAFEVRVVCDAPARFVWLEDPEDPTTRFDDNLVDLEAGEHTFACRSSRPTTAEALKARLTVRDLSSCVPQVSLASLLDEMVDPDANTYLDAVPWRGRLWSSYDRRSVSPDDLAGWLANDDRSQYVRDETNAEGRVEHVMMDAKGPGALVRLWTANGRDAVLRFYFDGSPTPLFEGVGTNLIGGHVICPAPLSAALSSRAPLEHRAQNLYLPLPYAKSLKVTVETPNADKRFWYNAEVREYAEGVSVETVSDEVLRRTRNRIGDACAKLRAEPGDVSSARCFTGTSFKLEGPATIRSLALDAGEADARKVRVRIDFDGSETVDVSLAQLRGLMGTALSMPFRRSCRIKTSAPASGCVVTASYRWDAQRSLYFYAKDLDFPKLPTRKGEVGPYDLTWAELTGRGRLVGHALIVGNDYLPPEKTGTWWGEGDEKIWVDGEAFPSYFGTGTEDFFGYAWGEATPYDHPFLKMPVSDRNVFRLRRLDSVPFERSLKLDVEIWHNHTEPTWLDYAPATFWYARQKVES